MNDRHQHSNGTTSQSKPEGRVPPYDAGAEAAVLGSVLLSNEALPLVLAIVDERHFYIEAHRRIFAAMTSLANSNVPVDHVTLGTALKQAGDLEKIGGAQKLSLLTDSVATVANVEHYARIVKEKAIVRQTIYTASEIAAEGFNNPADVDEWLARAATSIMAATSTSGNKGAVPVMAAIKKAISYLEQEGDPPGLVKTGIGKLDEFTGGLWPGLLTVMAGRPSMGKSAEALNIAFNASLAGKKVKYDTMEDTELLTSFRLLSRAAGVDLEKIVLRELRREHWPKILGSLGSIDKIPFWFDESRGMTAQEIRRKAAAHKHYHGLDLLVVDHLGRIAGDGKLYERTTEAALVLSDTAHELGIPVLLNVQLSREVEKRTDKRPLLSDLRDSGQIEEVARSVWLLYRPHYYYEDEDPHELQHIVAKASHGRTGMVKLWCDLPHMFICDPRDRPENPNRPIEQKQMDY